MAATQQPRPGLVRPEYGPSGPELIRRRWGARGVRAAVAGVVLAALVLAVLIARAGDGITLLEHRSAPVFTLLYPAGQLHRVAPQPGELLRLTSHRGRLRMAVTVGRLRLPPYRGSVAGVLPIYADRAIDRLAGELPAFQALTDGKARVNDAPGYQFGYRFGPPGHRTLGTDVFVVAKDGDREGVLIRYRQANPPGGPAGPGRDLVKSTRSAFRSFRFGLDRP